MNMMEVMMMISLMLMVKSNNFGRWRVIIMKMMTMMMTSNYNEDDCVDDNDNGDMVKQLQ